LSVVLNCRNSERLWLCLTNAALCLFVALTCGGVSGQ
jgi:hypothetical protein